MTTMTVTIYEKDNDGVQGVMRQGILSVIVADWLAGWLTN
jgi:hypothetical protein